ncbi:MAG TPA: bifunctional 2-polyprenyl-6-hydroxyphenol methylase/3-demethylubiquinol 3-O-methyltransferase UbiG [Chloroflexota bacterium]|nr:bifunctional 2-polyprenyl-6-hydroxyphenol methylase/3-demethylubiquinol 3-O-methyltransferase UbiG [Chloroflexota bacterium]
MPIDNTLYDLPGDIWWDDAHPLATLRTMVNPGRVPYFLHVLVNRLELNPSDTRVLEVGCGGGLLAEEIAGLGFSVTGIDPSEPSLTIARAHAARSGFRIDYRTGVGERIPFPDASFPVVLCCDVLEHVQDLDKVVAEIARVLAPGGVFLYDTINRTLLSKLIAIKVIQEWPATRFVPANLHDWQLFIKPAELRSVLERHGLNNIETTGLRPAAGPLALLLAARDFRSGKLNFGQLGRRLAFRRTRLLACSYMGYAREPVLST